MEDILIKEKGKDWELFNLNKLDKKYRITRLKDVDVMQSPLEGEKIKIDWIEQKGEKFVQKSIGMGTEVEAGIVGRVLEAFDFELVDKF